MDVMLIYLSMSKFMLVVDTIGYPDIVFIFIMCNLQLGEVNID